MSNLSEFLGGGGGAPIGTIVTGNINDPKWLKLDNTVYNRSAYPNLDVSKMLTFDGQSVGTSGQTLVNTGADGYRVIWIEGTTWYAQRLTLGSTQAYKSTDNGATWTSVTLPSAANYNYVYYAGGLYFFVNSHTGNANQYWTSTDGISWTARTFPSIGGYGYGVGAVAFIGGLYVALVSYTQNIYYPAMYSANGISGWTAVALNQSNTTNAACLSNLYQSYAKRATTIGGRVYIALSQFAGSPTFNMWSTADGVNWTITPSSGLLSPFTTTTAGGPNGWGGYDAFGNWVQSGQTWVNLASGGTRMMRNIGVPLFSGGPSGGSNLWTFNWDEISEDHGVTGSRIRLTGANLAGANTDFSGSRLLSISAGGTVTWIDVSTSKFRAAPLPASQTEAPSGTQYIKVA